jgi:hypothetical protein
VLLFPLITQYALKDFRDQVFEMAPAVVELLVGVLEQVAQRSNLDASNDSTLLGRVFRCLRYMLSPRDSAAHAAITSQDQEQRIASLLLKTCHSEACGKTADGTSLLPACMNSLIWIMDKRAPQTPEGAYLTILQASERY